jgi:hypothetical protein
MSKSQWFIISAGIWLFLANDLTKKLVGGLALFQWSLSPSNPSHTYTEADVMWEARVIFFHILLGWLNIRKASDV